MTKFLSMFTHIGFLLIIIMLMSRIQTSQTASARSRPLVDTSSDDDNSEVEEDRRMYDLDQLRRFLLTANSEQRAAKREQQDFYKRELVIYLSKNKFFFYFLFLFRFENIFNQLPILIQIDFEK